MPQIYKVVNHIPTSLVALLFIAAGGLFLQSCETDSQSENTVSEQDRPHVEAENPVEAGRYLTVVGGCNDCHTAGYLQKKGKIPDEDRLTGNPVGYRGPWGTTYASNLRLLADTVSADAFVKMLHTRTKLPPMPWMNLNQISERDARAMYAYLKHLGSKGKAMPENVPPGKEPDTPFILMAPQNTGAKSQANAKKGKPKN